jgi:hypothetical protein
MLERHIQNKKYLLFSLKIILKRDRKFVLSAEVKL